MTPRTALLGAVGALLALQLAGQACAAVITFDGLSGASADPLMPYSEAGFTVTPTLGAWKQSQVFGDPLPSIYVSDLGRDAPFGNLSVTAAGGLFVFQSLDLQAFNSGVGYEIRGSRGGSVLFSVAGGQSAGPAFATLMGGSGLAIDTLTFDVSSGGPGSFNVDNIRVNAVPEPATGLLLLSGLGLAGAALRRRGRAFRPAACAGRPAGVRSARA